MAITQVGTPTTGSSPDGTSFTVTKPTGVASGDVLVVTGSSNKGAWDTLPSGFTQVVVSTDANLTANFRTYVWYKVCGGSEPASYTFASTTAQGSGAPMVAAMSAWRGVDTTGNPILASNADEANTYTTNPTTSITTTGNGRVIYAVAARKASATGSTTISFSTATSGWQEDADVSRWSGGSVMYGTALYSKTADDAAGTFTEPSVTLGGTGGTQDGSTYFILALKQAATPASGDFALQLSGVSQAFAGSVHDDATMAIQLGGISQDFNATHNPPASGVVSMQLSQVVDDFAATATGGSMGMQLGQVTSTLTGSVNPIGDIGMQLGGVSMLFGVETVPFGEHVIHVENEWRAFRVIDGDPGLIYIPRSKVHPVGKIDISLSPVTMNFAGDGAHLYASLAVQLSPVTINFGQDDLMKYVTNVGDGSTTSITVTHNAGTKDVVVAVYDNNSPYEEVVPQILHATTTTVTLGFSSAPGTNQYRAVVLWSLL